MGQATIFNGQKIKTLKDTLTLNGKSDIISSTVDPTASAVDAPIGSLLINQTSGKLYRKLDPGSSVNWEEVGAGVGGINYILNPSAEVNTTGWATYADAAGTAPVDGSGGSPNVTWTRSTTSPLRGVADFNLAKDAANRQGQGVSYDFTIDEADKAKVLSVTFDYEVLSGTYADGDLTVYLIADPTGTPVVIQPAGYTVQAATVGTTMREIATFQTQATGTSYRLCFHVASTSASAYTLAIDNVVVGPQQTVQGAAISDWVSFTPTGSWVANTTYTGRWKRVGDSVQVQASLSLTGAPTATRLTINLPSGLVIDNTKRSGGSGATINNIFGTGKTFDGATAVHNLTVAYESTTAVAVSYESTATAQLNNVTNTTPFAYNSGDVLDIEYTVPISGWSSNTVMSQDTDTRVVAARYTHSTNQACPALGALTFDTLVFDTHSAFSGSQYFVPVSGIYEVKFYGSSTGSPFGVATQAHPVYLGVNGSVTNPIAVYTANAAGTTYENLQGSCLVQAKAGDFLQIIAATNGIAFTFTGLQVEFKRLSGPATIAASETVAASYENTAGTSITAAGVLIPYANKKYDTHSAFNGTTFTAPISGIYRVNALMTIASATYTASQQVYINLIKGSSFFTNLNNVYGNGVGADIRVAGSTTLKLLAGETISIQGASTTTQTLFPAAGYNYVMIERVGN